MRTWTTLILLFVASMGFAQSKEASQILEEGILLYFFEKASWHSTDDFLLRFPDKTNVIGGYVSYKGMKDTIVTIFYSNQSPIRILARYFYAGGQLETPVFIDTLNVAYSDKEGELMSMRDSAIARVSSNENKVYTYYENTNFNFVPIIHQKRRRVYILTAPVLPTVVLIGNDYRLTFDKKNRIKKEEKLHNSLLQFPYTSGDPEKKLESTRQSHVVSDLITPTDICTLLLYRDFVEWDTHYVISKKYVSIFNLKLFSLGVLTRKAWDNIAKGQRK
jgi:hypothetical protein